MLVLKESLATFFAKNKKKITSQKITICLGNEGCDLDSFISSLIVSYTEDHIFVVNMRKDVFISKGDLMFVCDKFGICVNDLIFLEKPQGIFSSEAKKIGTYFLVDNEKYFINDKEVTIIITDHNEPIEELRDCELEMIIDHHIITNNISSAKRIYIDIDVGSATTLVSKYLAHDLSKKLHCFVKKIKKNRSILCAQIASLLIIPILLDTNFLKKRVGAFDILEYRKLKKISCLKKKELKQTYKSIKKARYNDHLFDTSIILQKDLKTYNSADYIFGMSVIKYKFEDWIDRETKDITGLEKDKEGIALLCKLQAFKEKMGLDFYFVSTKIKGVRTIIILDFPFLKNLMNEMKMHKIEYKGLIYFKIDIKFTRKIFIPKIIDMLLKNCKNCQ